MRDLGMKAPFFIIGCVRSGTTMLRDILRRHPNLACPEETHFYRWGEPFGAPAYRNVLVKNVVLRRHRERDGITEPEFQSMLDASISRTDLCQRYMALYIERNKPGATRWFDKTPQNVYGAAIAAAIPNSRFIHIVRNPVEVVASLRIGKEVKIENLVGACNYWNEAADILFVLKHAFPKRVYEVRYEDFVRDPIAGVERLLQFVDEPFDKSYFEGVGTREVTHADEGVLTPEEVARVEELCRVGRLRYGYEVEVPAAAVRG